MGPLGHPLAPLVGPGPQGTKGLFYASVSELTPHSGQAKMSTNGVDLRCPKQATQFRVFLKDWGKEMAESCAGNWLLLKPDQSLTISPHTASLLQRRFQTLG